MKKKIKWKWIIGCLVAAALLCFIKVEIDHTRERLRYREEMFQTAIDKMMNEQEEEAVRILDEECTGHAGVNFVKRIAMGVEAYRNNKINDAYGYTNLKITDSADYLTEEQLTWITDKMDEIEKVKKEYDQEQKLAKEERKKQEEKEKLRKLRESGVPYVGMSEDLIAKTSLGSPRSTIRHNCETISGKVYTANLYDFPSTGNVTFTARCVNGKVTDVFDGRGKQGVDPKYLTGSGGGSSGSSSSGAKEYYSAEDLYEDRPDDFDSLEDAENYFDDHY